jgi:thiamine-phosphate pyrophosphorylase
MTATVARLRRPPNGLYALTSDLDDTTALRGRVAAALAGGARAIQYRNKRASRALRLEQAAALRDICRAHSATFIVNDEVDVALAVGADGVHLGRDDEAIAAARSRLGPAAIVGASCYDSIERAQSAVAAGADYVAFGSFHISATKPGALRADPSVLTVAKARLRVPVVAIGGITVENGAALIAAGADALAVISALFDAPDVEMAARAIAKLFDR